MPPKHSTAADRALVAALMERLAPVPVMARMDATGISYPTLQRWRVALEDGEPIAPLQPATRVKAENYVRLHPVRRAPLDAAALSGSTRQQIRGRLERLQAHVNREIATMLELLRDE